MNTRFGRMNLSYAAKMSPYRSPDKVALQRPLGQPLNAYAILGGLTCLARLSKLCEPANFSAMVYGENLEPRAAAEAAIDAQGSDGSCVNVVAMTCAFSCGLDPSEKEKFSQ